MGVEDRPENSEFALHYNIPSEALSAFHMKTNLKIILTHSIYFGCTSEVVLEIGMLRSYWRNEENFGGVSQRAMLITSHESHS